MPLPDVVAGDVDQLEAAAAEVADDAVRLLEARDDAERGELGLVARPRAARSARPQRLGRGCEEGRAVRGIARGGGGEHDRCRRRRIVRQSTRKRASAASARATASSSRRPVVATWRPSPAQHLLVEDRRRRAGEALIGDEAHRVRADVDDRRSARPTFSRPGASRRFESCRSALSTFRERSWGLTSSAICRGPDRLGLVMKYLWALNGSSPVAGAGSARSRRRAIPASSAGCRGGWRP